MSTALGIFELLGFKYNDEKLDPFDKVATMLGVELDLREIGKGLIKVQNKPSRVAEVSESGVIESAFFLHIWGDYSLRKHS